MAAQKGEEERKRALRLKGIRWPIHMCAHTSVLLLQSNRHWPFLLLMHHFLFSGYLLLIYFAALPAMKERAGEPVPPSFSASHILYSFCFLFYFLFVILPPSVLPLKLHSPLPLSVFPVTFSTRLASIFSFSPFLHLFYTSDSPTILQLLLLISLS